MTIKALSAFLKKHAPFARRKVPTYFFAYRTVAIDGHLLSYAYMSTALGSEAKKMLHAKNFNIDPIALLERWLGRWISTLTMMLEAKMLPVLVLDGPNVPPEKKETRAKRQASKQGVRDEIKQMQDLIDAEDLLPNFQARERMVKLISRDIRVTEAQFARLIGVVEAMGIPVLIADGEGEALCATLVKTGQCSAIFTQDSDAGPYLCPMVINEIGVASYDSEGNRFQECEVIYYRQVMTKLGLSEDQFIDLCIMSGTDYNDNVPGVGTGKAYPLIKKWGGIEGIPAEKYDPSILNFVRVREIFKDVYKVGKGDLERPVVDGVALTRLLGGLGLMKLVGRVMRAMKGDEGSEVDRDMARGEDDEEWRAEDVVMGVDPGDLL